MNRVVRTAAIAAAFCTGLALSPAQAQVCAQTFKVDGVPLVTGLTYRSHQLFPGLDVGSALTKLRRAMAAEGFEGIREDRANGSLTALQETSGSGRPQTFRVTARKTGGATRVDAVFIIQPGQITDADMIRSYMCRVISGAGY
jgi:hypothetical protein